MILHHIEVHFPGQFTSFGPCRKLEIRRIFSPRRVIIRKSGGERDSTWEHLASRNKTSQWNKLLQQQAEISVINISHIEHSPSDLIWGAKKYRKVVAPDCSYLVLELQVSIVTSWTKKLKPKSPRNLCPKFFRLLYTTVLIITERIIIDVNILLKLILVRSLSCGSDFKKKTSFGIQWRFDLSLKNRQRKWNRNFWPIWNGRNQNQSLLKSIHLV